MDNMIRFGADVCADVERASCLEWLETNGIGGFASSSIAGLNTRRYHGLLTAATTPPVGRVVLLSKLEETLIVNGGRYELSANRYSGAVHPRGFEHLREFRLDPGPVWTYEAAGVRLEKRVSMVDGENTTVIEYTIAGDAALEVRPLIAFRDYHSTTHENSGLDPTVEERAGVVKLAPYPGLPPLYLAHGNGQVGAGNGWYRNFEFDRERERGLDFREDLYNPLVLTFAGSARIAASTEADPGGLETGPGPADPPATLVAELTRAANQFIVRRGNGKTVIAGYHWFSDWGRDTMIALPGLTLVTGRHDVARQILSEFAQAMNRGMLPNRFPDAGETPEYNTVDATLWFFEAVRAYARYTRDLAFVRELYPKLKESVDWHLRGTRYAIRVDADGLLSAGESGVQLTWMDAKVGDWVVTPRHGKPVEIQALWYNALRIMEDLAQRFGDATFAGFVRELAGQARESFRRQFWNDADGCLYDVVHGDDRDASIRPNQIFAVSLLHSMLDAAQSRQVLEVVERDLFTPLGLRSLSPRDPRYRGRYEGDVTARDSAYHQGTVWPWLMGTFVTATVRVHGEAGRVRAAAWLEHFREVMRTAGLGQVPEIADGDAPHTARGCIAQAWSVGELLRAAVEDAGCGAVTPGRPPR